MNDDFLAERIRAEDIILGALGFDGDARIVSIKQHAAGYSGIAHWPDGEQFQFNSEDELTELELWALQVLQKELTNEQKS